ncbi:recombinase family protein [Sutterella wadsworthensis]|uniref:recombinase family protein n=1 Tax=Sutterella wadsworthensis TaxID=40545 RepID=UPI0013F5DEEF|nr:recombinase family protein [Sutterella wadsworthensis]
MESPLKIGYARISTEEHNFDRQLQALRDIGVEPQNIFTDKGAGKNAKRPGFEGLLHFLRRGDALYVVSMDRLSCSLQDLFTVTTTLRDRDVSIHFLKEHIDLEPNEVESLMTSFTMLGAVAQFERELIRERQREGIALTKKKGLYRGRRPTDPKVLEEAQRRIDMGIPVTRVAKDLKVGRSTLYKRLKTLSTTTVNK